MCTYLIGSGPKIKEINGSPFANLFSEAAPRGGEANEGGARRRALELSAAVREGQSARLGPRLLVHLPCPPGRIPLVPSVLQDRKVRRRGFALANTQPFATVFCGLFPLLSYPTPYTGVLLARPILWKILSCSPPQPSSFTPCG